MPFNVFDARQLIARMYKMSARRKAFLVAEEKKKKKMAKDAETIKRTFGQEIRSFCDDVPPAKKVKTGGDKEQGDRVDVERTLDGAIKIKEERDSWGCVKESFDEVSECTTVISNVAYYSSYNLPEPVDLHRLR